MKKLDLNGLWWLPEEKEKQVAGNIQFDAREGIKLNLNGSFNPSIEQLGEPKNFDIIQGITSNGKLVSLVNCFATGSNFSFPGYESVVYQARYLFIGFHLEKLEELSFETYNISFNNLNAWASQSGFNIDHKLNSDKSLSEAKVTYKFPEVEEIATINDTKMSLNYTFNAGGDHISNVILNQKTFIKFENESGIQFEDFIRTYLYNIQNFLCLAVGTPVFPVEIKVRSKSFDREFDGEIIKNEIQAYMAIANFPDKLKDKRTSQMILPYRYIKNELNTIINSWFDKQQLLQPAYDLYFGTMYNTSMYLQHRFLSLVQAIESYHRRVYEGKYLEDDEYEKLKEQIVSIIKDNLTGDLKSIFTQKLSYLNEFSLRKRLKDIIQMHQETIEAAINIDKDFINSVLDTRNYLTHFDEKLEKRAKKGKELFSISEVLKFLLEICLMVEVGVPRERIIKNITDNHKYDYIKSMVGTHS